MVRPRGRRYILEPVAHLLENRSDEIDAMIAALNPYLEDMGETLEGFEGNSFLTRGDASVLAAMVRHYKPKHIVEVGSGTSTHIMRRAAVSQNLDLHIKCIDPEPRRDIDAVADIFVRQNIVDCDTTLADDLEAGDFLFIDGSHYAFNGTDVPFLFLEVMPRLKPGVIVHVHDIHLPFEYSELFTERNYNEQYLLAALLLGGGAWKPLLPLFYLSRRRLLPEGSSFWIEKTS